MSIEDEDLCNVEPVVLGSVDVAKTKTLHVSCRVRHVETGKLILERARLVRATEGLCDNGHLLRMYAPKDDVGFRYAEERESQTLLTNKAQSATHPILLRRNVPREKPSQGLTSLISYGITAHLVTKKVK